MVLKTEQLKKLTEDSWVLVTYDIKGRHYTDDAQRRARIRKEIRNGANRDDAIATTTCDNRNLFRDKLYRLCAVKQNDSVYFVPAKLLSKREELILVLKTWGIKYGVEIKAYGVNIDDEDEIKSLSTQYTQNLVDLLKEMDDNLQEANQKMKDLEDEIKADPKKKLTGAYRIIEGVSVQFTDCQALVNRWGSDSKQWQLDRVKFSVDGLINRWNNIRKSRKLEGQIFDLKDKGIRK